ncbi:MAG: twin-arginine translocase TatA/TatE family subunit [Bdellovibrionales bacterium]|nr:twin-arginine translocase TatA/TatE family subunit [Bdellovibrionales bacterium]
MFGLGFTEILFITLIAFLVFGPQKFPSVVKKLIQLLNELKATVSDVNSEFYDIKKDVKQDLNNLEKEVKENLNLLEEKKKTKK